MFNFLQTQQAQICAAIIIALITISAFIVIAIRNYRRNKPTKEDLWTADGYYNYLLAVVKASRDFEELQAAWFMVENTWYTKRFRVQVSPFERSRRYVQLCDAYAKMETKLTQIPMPLCTN